MPHDQSGARRAAALATFAVAAAAASSHAYAGVTFRLDRQRAASGEPVRIQALFFNDGNADTRWQAPRTLALQWRDGQGRVLRSEAKLEGGAVDVDVPVGRFSSATWDAVVPPEASGLQAIAIEGEPVLLALDAVAGAPLAQSPAQQVPAGQSPAQPGQAVAATHLGDSDSSGAGPTAGDAHQAPGYFDNQVLDRFRSSLSPYEPIYFDFGTQPHTNARFQLSLKFRISPPADNDAPTFWNNIYFGYTQTSVWDIGKDSAPFRDTSYKPALFWLSDRVWESADQRTSAGFEGGLEHESNGQGGADSRAVNSIYLRPTLRYRFGDGSTLSFTPKIRPKMWDGENPDLADYRGHVDYLLRWAQDDGLMLSALARQGSKQGSLQLDAAYPLRKLGLSGINGYLHMQYFTGYGETLLDYNQRAASQLRIGLMIVR
jgi:outer membrane phospholipase A